MKGHTCSSIFAFVAVKPQSVDMLFIIHHQGVACAQTDLVKGEPSVVLWKSSPDRPMRMQFGQDFPLVQNSQKPFAPTAEKLPPRALVVRT